MSVIYKTPKGSIDYYGESARKLDYMLKEIQQIFKQNGGELLDTPVFEKKDIILGKYGEEAETKLIYEIAENGGEKLVLRYDLTIPFIRFLQENNVKKCKRYSIGKVYRRDNPNASQGRFREFYQCDFDILGENNTNMISEAVILNMVSQIMKKMGIISYKIIINDTENLRKALDLVLSDPQTDIPNEADAPKTDMLLQQQQQQQQQQQLIKFKSICAAIDKLDKVSFNDIKKELAQKGLTEAQIDKLELVLRENGVYDENAKRRLESLYTIADIWGFRNNIEYNLSLARGLDYYNGIIFEVKLLSGDNVSNNVVKTSVMAGGRYDNLIPNSTLIGFSVGITRLLPFISPNCLKTNERQFYLTSIGAISLPVKLKIIKWCRDNIVGNSVFRFSYDDADKKLGKVIGDQLKIGTTDIIVIGEEELKENKIIHKDLIKNCQTLIALE